MKNVTVEECLNLQKKFKKYCETAEQHEFPLLMMVDLKMSATIQHIEEIGVIENQKGIRAMFRVVLRTIGEDFSEYLEEVK